jgi:hypothetical protein
MNSEGHNYTPESIAAATSAGIDMLNLTMNAAVALGSLAPNASFVEILMTLKTPLAQLNAAGFGITGTGITGT